MTVEIRDAELRDAAGIARAHVAAWRAAYPGIMPDAVLARLDEARSLEGWTRTLSDPGTSHRYLVAVLDGEIAGFAMAGAPREDAEEDRGELCAINLHPDHWRRGFGTVLFAAALAVLKEQGYRRGYLWVAAGNERAISFYERQGWPLDGREKSDPRFEPPLRELRCSSESL